MSAIDDVHVHVNTRIERERFELVAEVGCPVLRTSTHCQIGLSCVIEEMSGNKSYWALMHSPGKPDFHHHSTFTASLPAL
ncbi:MAG TPA: hypothetical protein VET48_12265 [Steroidobacteraceae bacterium]|nr:hypothetical protein [Steroidobacteraceae bacterium]